MVEGRGVFDTNALLINPSYVDEVETPLVPYTVLQELDRIKMEKDTDRGWQARRAVRILKNNSRVDFVEYTGWDSNTYTVWNSTLPFKNNDDLIVDAAVYAGANFIVTGDFLMQLKAKARGLGVVDIFETLTDEEDYTGYVDKSLTEKQLAKFYENLDKNTFNLLTNQYLVLRDKDLNVVQTLKWNGQEYTDTQKTRKGFKTVQFGKFEPRDIYQQFALDSLQSNQVTMVKGKAGSGKSLLSLNYAIHQMETRKFSKIICFVNPMAARGSARLGFYPGTRDEKLLDSAVGSMLGAKFGSKMEIENMINQERLILLPFSDIRGFDTTNMNAIVYIVEAQNLDIDLMKLAVQRVGEDSKLIIDGDYNAQVDSSLYEGSNNGMRRLSQVFRGEDYYGEVELPHIYRSRIAEKADQM